MAQICYNSTSPESTRMHLMPARVKQNTLYASLVNRDWLDIKHNLRFTYVRAFVAKQGSQVKMVII